MIVYGIKNCDTVKKTLTWLDENKIQYQFHDFKKLGVDEKKLEEWSSRVGWEALINKRGTTWRKLEPEVQNLIVSKEAAFRLMLDKTSVIKRPVSEVDGEIVLGFDTPALAKLTKHV